MEEKGSRLVESNGVCIDCQSAHGISQTQRINLDAQRLGEKEEHLRRA
jgi:hypothetical protein